MCYLLIKYYIFLFFSYGNRIICFFVLLLLVMEVASLRNQVKDHQKETFKANGATAQEINGLSNSFSLTIMHFYQYLRCCRQGVISWSEINFHLTVCVGGNISIILIHCTRHFGLHWTMDLLTANLTSPSQTNFSP